MTTINGNYCSSIATQHQKSRIPTQFTNIIIEIIFSDLQKTAESLTQQQSNDSVINRIGPIQVTIFIAIFYGKL